MRRLIDFLNSGIAWPAPVFEQETGGGSGGSDGGEGGTGSASDQGVGKEGQDGGPGDKPEDTVVTGGTAEGDDNPEDVKDPKEEAPEGDQGEVPEQYDFSDVVPEGVEVDQDMVNDLDPIFREAGLSQAQANKMAEAYIKAQERTVEQQNNQVAAMMKEWVDTAKGDKEIGNTNWDTSVRDANAFIKKFGTPELVEDVLVGQGLGNHPEVIRLFARAGKAFSDDTTPSGGATDTTDKSDPAANWYGSTTPSTKKG